MGRLIAFYNSTIGKKFTMAVTGIILVGFVVGHMLGNLKIYMGAADYDGYAKGLREFAYPLLGKDQFLWFARIVLLGAVALHIRSAIALSRINRQARPEGYRKTHRQESTYASLSMRIGGIFLIFFIVYHILHFTTGQAHHDFQYGQVYDNVVSGFNIWWVAAVYLLAMIPLGLHLYHGVWSMLQTLGVSHPKYNHLRRRLSLAVSLLVVLGNISFPLAVLTGVVK